MNIKIVLSIISAIIGLWAFFPYIKDTLSLKTQPHIYTWLIWTLTQGTGLVGIWYGGGGWGGLSLVVGITMVVVVLLFSLKYGTKNITRWDTGILTLALISILIWWQLHQAILAVVMISIIDFLGYIPSYRKTYSEPWSETLVSWAAFAISNILSVFALTSFNLLTATYLIVIAFANTLMFAIGFYRRRFIPKPNN
jgi:hypothetical protein